MPSCAASPETSSRRSRNPLVTGRSKRRTPKRTQRREWPASQRTNARSSLRFASSASWPRLTSRRRLTGCSSAGSRSGSRTASPPATISARSTGTAGSRGRCSRQRCELARFCARRPVSCARALGARACARSRASRRSSCSRRSASRARCVAQRYTSSECRWSRTRSVTSSSTAWAPSGRACASSRPTPSATCSQTVTRSTRERSRLGRKRLPSLSPTRRRRCSSSSANRESSSRCLRLRRGSRRGIARRGPRQTFTTRSRSAASTALATCSRSTRRCGARS